jgi:hypothetical protein
MVEGERKEWGQAMKRARAWRSSNPVHHFGLVSFFILPERTGKMVSTSAFKF